MTDCDFSSGDTKLSSSVKKIDIALEEHTLITKTLNFYKTVRTPSDLSNATFELKLKYTSGSDAFTKALTVTDNQVEIALAHSEIAGLTSKEFIFEIYRTEAAITSKVSEGMLEVT